MVDTKLFTTKLNYEQYFNLKKKKIKLIYKFYVPSQDAKLKSIWAPYLTPFLGKDKLKEFCDLFNKNNIQTYKKGIYIPIFFILYDSYKFECILRTPNLFYLLKLLYDLDKLYSCKKENKILYYITLEEIYLLLNLKSNILISYNLKILLNNIIIKLKNFGIKIII